MSQCWLENPRNRPSFTWLRSRLDTLLLAGQDYLELFNIDVPIQHSDSSSNASETESLERDPDDLDGILHQPSSEDKAIRDATENAKNKDTVSEFKTEQSLHLTIENKYNFVTPTFRDSKDLPLTDLIPTSYEPA